MMRGMDHTAGAALLLMILLAGALACDSGVEDALPAIPRMASPANGATDQANALELQWAPASEAETYHVQVSSTENFSNNDVDEQEVKVPFLVVRGLTLGETYYWRVRARNAVGFSDWSVPWHFTPTSEAVVPAVPGLQSPANDAASLTLPVTFSWTATPGARTYHLQLSQEPTFLRKDADIENVTLVSKTVFGLEHGYTYYWRVRAKNPAGYSNWSAVWKIVIET